MRSLDPEGNVILLGFDRRIAALPACIDPRRSFGCFTAAAPAPTCRARLQVRRLDWGRTPGLRMGLRDRVGSVVVLGFNRSVAALPASRWSIPRECPGGPELGAVIIVEASDAKTHH
jgi:hypothetical protein